MKSSRDERTARSGWKRPVVQFVVAGLIAAAVLAVTASWFSRRAAEQEAVDQAVTTNELLARAVVQPALTAGLMSRGAADVDRFDRLMRSRVTGGEALRVKLWDSEGVIIYSDEPRLIGDEFALDEEEREVLDSGVSHGELSNVTSPENQFEQPLGRVLEVYTAVDGPDGEPLLFEVYYEDDGVAERRAEIVRAFQPVTVGGILLFLVLTVPLVYLLARRLSDSAAARERLLLTAVRASDAERRRIARDVHDGVVQDLAGTSFALSATERELSNSPGLATGELRSRLHSMAISVRQSLTALRSLLVEIYPPELAAEGLAPALEDLVAPAIAAGIDVELDLPSTQQMPEDVMRLIWRTAQEAVRNALRHGEPQLLRVRVDAPSDRLPSWVLEVIDDGQGFDPAALPPQGHFGIRGLQDLAQEAGGVLTVDSAVGEGTTVRLKVPSR